MDVNNTRYHLLLGEKDWLEGATISLSGSPPQPELEWDPQRQVLQLRPRLFRFPASPGDRPPRAEDRRGAACDRFGNWYWIAEDGQEIRFLSASSRRAQHFWSPSDTIPKCPEEGDFRPIDPAPLPDSLPLSGLTVTALHFLVVGVLDPAGLLVFDLHGGGEPLQLRWPDDIPFEPLDMAAAPGGGLWILDRQPRYWGLDRHLRVLTLLEKETGEPDFVPSSGQAVPRPPVALPDAFGLESASPIEERHAVSLEALPDGSVLILENEPGVPFSVISRYRFGNRLGAPFPLEGALGPFVTLPSGADPAQLSLRGHDFAFIPESRSGTEFTGTLYVASAGGNQAFAFRLVADEEKFSLRLLPRYLPMRLFSGKALAACGKVVYYDLDEQWLALMEQPRRRYGLQGEFTSRVFDGKEPTAVWHRLFLDGCIPPGTEVRVESRAADLEDLVPQLPWRPEPVPYRRYGGSELPYTRQLLSAAEQSGLQQEQRWGTWELLLQQARGRFLQLRLTLRGNQVRTPQLEVLRVYYPRFSYLHEYLPGVYRRDKTSAFFLERFLANLEGFYTVLEGRIAELQGLLDPDTAAPGVLPWLAGWLGIVLDPSWDEARRRLFLRHALELYNQRGTLAGLIRWVRLAIDPCPDDSLFGEAGLESCLGGRCSQSRRRVGPSSVRVVENFLVRDIPAVMYGDPEDADVPQLIATEKRWTPDQGAEPLHRSWRGFRSDRGRSDLSPFPPLPPSTEPALGDWRDFVDQKLDFPYAEAGQSDAPAYRALLTRRYRSVERLNAAYQLTGGSRYASFDGVTLPASNDFPGSGPRLFDWIQFVSQDLPIRRNAHRFTVLVPVNPEQDAEAQTQKLELVQRIVDLEKPAHTFFEVRPFWALFRVGEARVALDTTLGPGSRFGAFTLGLGALAEDYLGSGHPFNVRERFVSDRS